MMRSDLQSSMTSGIEDHEDLKVTVTWIKKNLRVRLMDHRRGTYRFP